MRSDVSLSYPGVRPTSVRKISKYVNQQAAVKSFRMCPIPYDKIMPRPRVGLLRPIVLMTAVES